MNLVSNKNGDSLSLTILNFLDVLSCSLSLRRIFSTVKRSETIENMTKQSSKDIKNECRYLDCFVVVGIVTLSLHNTAPARESYESLRVIALVFWIFITLAIIRLTYFLFPTKSKWKISFSYNISISLMRYNRNSGRQSIGCKFIYREEFYVK